MRWDLAFYVKNLPPEYRCHDDGFMMVGVSDPHIEMLAEGTRDLPGPQEFFTKEGNATISVVIFRLEAEDEGKALILGQHYLEGFIDALAILLDRNLPQVGSLVEIRREAEENTHLLQIGSPGWAYFSPRDQSTVDRWKERQRKVFLDLMPFFDVAAGVHPHRSTSLSRQLLHSMKMYRAGAQTEDFGLEFICKWSALEGLVCGGELRNKGQLLRDRLSALLPNPPGETETLVKELWKFRSQAVHEALAFRSEHLNEAPPLATRIESVDRLFLAVVTFAIAHLEKADSVQTLWPFVAAFQMPAHTIEVRPSDMVRVVMTNIKFETNRQVTGGGILFDKAFAHNASVRAAQVAGPTANPAELPSVEST